MMAIEFISVVMIDSVFLCVIAVLSIMTMVIIVQPMYLMTGVMLMVIVVNVVFFVVMCFVMAVTVMVMAPLSNLLTSLIHQHARNKSKRNRRTINKHMNTITHQSQRIRINPVSHLDPHKSYIQT